MTGKRNIKISAKFTSTHNEQYFRRGKIYNLRKFQSLYTNCKKPVRFGAEMVTYSGLQFWNFIPDNINNVSSLENFKRGIKKWKYEKCP